MSKATPTGQNFRPFYKMIAALQDIPDSLQEERIRDTFLAVLKVIDTTVDPANNLSVMKVTINFFISRAKKNEKAKSWLLKNKERLNDVMSEQGFKLSLN